MLPVLRLCAAALAAGAVLAAPAAAQAPVPTPVAPADGATAQAGTPLTFTARGQGALVVRVARSPAVVDACGAIAEDGGRFDGAPSPADPTLVQFTAPAGLAAGEWFWQVGDPAGLQRRAGAPHHGRRVGRRRRRRRPARRRSARRRPRRQAAQARAHPDPVAHRHQQPRAARPRAGRGLALGLAQPLRRPRAQQRPPLAPGRARPGQARPPPGRRARRRRLRRAPSSPQGALGTTTLLRQNYVRVRRVCAAAGCRTTRTPVGSRVVERDLALLPDVPWAQGPAHPTARSTTSRP